MGSAIPALKTAEKGKPWWDVAGAQHCWDAVAQVTPAALNCFIPISFRFPFDRDFSLLSNEGSYLLAASATACTSLGTTRDPGLG